MRASLGGLFAVAEAYPDLKTNQNFMQLQTRITGLENGIADGNGELVDSWPAAGPTLLQSSSAARLSATASFGPRRAAGTPSCGRRR